MQDNQIIIRGLSKAFGNKVVLKDLDLDIPRGKSVAVIGASGTGKSVLLKCALGLIEADSGSIRVDGQEMLGASRQQREATLRKFGMTFQGGALFDSLTIWENVIFRYRQGKTLSRDGLGWAVQGPLNARSAAPASTVAHELPAPGAMPTALAVDGGWSAASAVTS